MRKEVLSILKDEIIKRNLNPNLITWVEAETNTISEFEKKSIKNKIENLQCPNCNSKQSELRGWEINTVASFIINFIDSSNNRILCNSCGRQKKAISFVITLFAGWWSRSGILQTPYTLIKDLINLFFQKKISNKIINELIENHNGLLRLEGTDKETLFKLVEWHNIDFADLEPEEQE